MVHRHSSIIRHRFAKARNRIPGQLETEGHKKAVAELIGTFWLVLGGCGAAVLATGFPEVGINLLGVSLAFGISVITMAYAIGHISGCHLNPAVTLGLVAGKRFPLADAPYYIGAQVVGAILAAAVLYLIASGQPGFSVSDGFATNGWGEHSPGGYSFTAALVTEVVMTAMFLLIIMGPPTPGAWRRRSWRRSRSASA